MRAAVLTSRPTPSRRWPDRSTHQRAVLPTVGLGVLWGWAVFSSYWRIAAPPALSDEYVYVSSGWAYVHGRPNSNPEHVPIAKYVYGLAQLLVGHQSLVAARVAAATCTLATAVVITRLLSTAVGRAVAHLGGAAYVLLPSAVWPQDTAFGRDAMLEPVAGLFIALSLAAVWTWSRVHGRSRPAIELGVLVGIATGLAAAAKELAFLPALGAILAVVIADRHARWPRLAQAATAGVSAVATMVVTYAPLGHPVDRAADTIVRQLTNIGTPHLVPYAGTVSDRPPWWTNLWFAGHSQGWGVTLVLLALAGLGLTGPARRFGRTMGAALLVAIAVQCAAVRLVLPFYWELWRVALVLAAAAGVRTLGQLSVVRARAALATATAIVLVPVVASGITVLTERPTGSSAIAAMRGSSGLHGDILVTGISPGELASYFPRAVSPTGHGPQVLERVPSGLGGVDTVAVTKPLCRDPRNREIEALAALNARSGALRLVHSDRLVDIYVVRHPLTRPTPAQVAAIGQDTETTGC